jgi:hypothetical protein
MRIPEDKFTRSLRLVVRRAVRRHGFGSGRGASCAMQLWPKATRVGLLQRLQKSSADTGLIARPASKMLRQARRTTLHPKPLFIMAKKKIIKKKKKK